jgi:hypothetical protein
MDVKETASRYRIPLVRRVCQRGDRDTPPECVRLNCVLSHSVFRWITEVRRGNREPRNNKRLGRPYRHETDAAIRSIPSEDPNISLRTVAEILSISPATVRTHMSRIDYTLKILRCIPHALTCEPKQVRLIMCLQSFPKLRAHAHNN